MKVYSYILGAFLTWTWLSRGKHNFGPDYLIKDADVEGMTLHVLS